MKYSVGWYIIEIFRAGWACKNQSRDVVGGARPLFNQRAEKITNETRACFLSVNTVSISAVA